MNKGMNLKGILTQRNVCSVRHKALHILPSSGFLTNETPCSSNNLQALSTSGTAIPMCPVKHQVEKQEIVCLWVHTTHPQFATVGRHLRTSMFLKEETNEKHIDGWQTEGSARRIERRTCSELIWWLCSAWLDCSWVPQGWTARKLSKVGFLSVFLVSLNQIISLVIGLSLDAGETACKHD